MADLKITNPKVVGKLKLPAESTSKALQVSATGELESSTVTTTELGHVAGLTSAAVSVNDTQTLTNKTLTSPAINTPTGIVKADVGLSNVDNTSDADKPVSTAQSTAIGLKLDASEKGAASGVATLDANSLIPITQIPPAALERLVIVADQTARFALTTATVQNGDTVKQTDTSSMYFIIDDANLGNAAGYAVYTAGTASSVDWGGITNIPAPVSALTGTNTGDQTAATVANTPAGNIAATDVQAAINELDSEKAAIVAGDIAHTSFSAANNQVAAANVTGLAFAAGSVKSFRAQVSVALDATTDLNEVFDLLGIQLAGGFVMSTASVGDDSGVVFSVTSAGQVQYTSANSAGFVSNVMKFRAEVTLL